MNPVLSSKEVRLFEERYGVKLPPSYRTFIMAVGDGWWGGIPPLNSCYGPSEESAWPGYLATPFPHTSEVHAGDLDDDEWDALTTGSMIIGDHSGCGSSARLIITGPAAGQVWEDCLGVDDTLRPGPDFGVWYPARLPRKPG
ncbi:SMI1/KNR4 family protein [Kitasatospora sp. NPDC093550]|uniref:SMI1/KNR4 family protein n=1 Tax=Kitasatospora sp. NPDC093550 TaxID=3364089 RepID=UPI003815A1C7